MDFQKFIDKAKVSSFYMGVLNWQTRRMIPFNKPHGFRILELSDSEIKTFIPYKKRNLNHIRGLHATAMATLAEFTSGFLLISRIDPRKYRIILTRLEMEYFYQGKTNGYGSFRINDDWLSTQVYQPLEKEDSTVVECPVKIVDTEGNHLATGTSHWQVKNWQKVKTKV
jgi:hypothetical protein